MTPGDPMVFALQANAELSYLRVHRRRGTDAAAATATVGCHLLYVAQV
jgi:hypothetical protein